MVSSEIPSEFKGYDEDDELKYHVVDSDSGSSDGGRVLDTETTQKTEKKLRS